MDYPALVVFDLDFTLWDCGGVWVDCAAWPFREKGGQVYDARGSRFHIYNDVPEILDELDDAGCEIALASRTGEPVWAQWVLDALNMRQRFHYEQIYPGSKLQHFRQLREESAVDYEDMVFFDDEHRNIAEVGGLGVTSVHVHRGVHRQAFDSGMDEWRLRRGSTR